MCHGTWGKLLPARAPIRLKIHIQNSWKMESTRTRMSTNENPIEKGLSKIVQDSVTERIGPNLESPLKSSKSISPSDHRPGIIGPVNAIEQSLPLAVGYHLTAMTPATVTRDLACSDPPSLQEMFMSISLILACRGRSDPPPSASD